MNEFYKGEQMGSTSRHVPLPTFTAQMDSQDAEKSEHMQKAGGGRAGAGMLSGYKKGDKPAAKQSESAKEEFDDLDFEENIKFMADGFSKN